MWSDESPSSWSPASLISATSTMSSPKSPEPHPTPPRIPTLGELLALVASGGELIDPEKKSPESGDGMKIGVVLPAEDHSFIDSKFKGPWATPSRRPSTPEMLYCSKTFAELKSMDWTSPDGTYKFPVGGPKVDGNGVSDFEWKYGVNRQRVHTKVDDEGNLTHTFTPGEDLIEFDRQRVKEALGRSIVPCLSTSPFGRMFLENKRFVLIDLSGTLHIDDVPTDNAIQALMKLRIHGYKVLFVTNTSKESRAKLHERLTRMQFDIKLEEIYTSLIATRKHVVENSLRPMLLVADEALEEFEGVDTNDPNCVVVGLSKDHFNQETLSIATRLILAKEAKIVAVHKGRAYRSATGMNMGPGCFVVALEMASGQVATTLGKPDVDFYLSALKYMGCDDPLSAVMIGDDVFDDVYGAMHAGITGILVKTGKYMKNDENKIPPHLPDFFVDNFCEAVERLVSAKKYLSKQ